MKRPCFFCDLNFKESSGFVAESKHFYVRYSDFPISQGHCEIIHTDHSPTMFTLSETEIVELNSLLKKTKQIVDKRYKPEGYNLGVNEGKAAGQSQEHLHIHIIPRYFGDVKNPAGGVRNIIPNKGNYFKELGKKFPERVKYIENE